MSTWIDGHFVGEQKLPVRTALAPFETMGARSGELPLWDLHLWLLHFLVIWGMILVAMPLEQEIQS